MGETACDIKGFNFFWSDFHSFPFPLKQAVHFPTQLEMQGCIKHEEMASFSCLLKHVSLGCGTFLVQFPQKATTLCFPAWLCSVVITCFANAVCA